MRQLLVSLAVGCAVAVCAGADELDQQIKSTFRRPANAQERVALVKQIEDQGGTRAARLLLGLVRRSDAALRHHYGRREALGGQIDGIFGPAIKSKRKITSSEDARLQQIKARQADADRAVAAELAGYRAAIDALARLGSAAREPLTAALSDRDWFVRLAAARALSGGLSDKDARVRIGAASTLDDKQAAAQLVALAKLVDDKHWQVRAVAIGALGRSGTTAAIKPLIDRLGEEKGRLREDLDQALEKLTGVSFGGNAKQWSGWWVANKPKIESGKFRKRKSKKGKLWQTQFSFYGIHSLSNRLVFVLDRSGSMRQKAMHKPPVLSGKARVFLPRGERKIDVARAQLKTALANLPKGAKFNIVFYNNGVIRLSQRLLRATPANLTRAFRFIDSTRAAGGTNIFDALFAATNLLGSRDAGLKLSLPNLKENPDTVFLLSDGWPNYGRYKKLAPMIAEMTWLNRQRQIRIHSIGIGDHNKSLMQRLAESTGGRYVALK